MKIGVISEGHADRAVITNIIIGLTGLDESCIEPLRPINNYDETDKAVLNPNTFSSWSVVKQECESRKLIDDFLLFEGQDFIVIHIDTAEADHYEINRPNKKSNDYCIVLRELVVKEINKWLKDDLSHNILYAVAVEEIDAWILTIYENKDSSTSVTPKEKLKTLLIKKGLKSTSNYVNYLKISKPLSKTKELTKGKFLNYNCSLNAFYEEIKSKVIPRLDIIP